MSKNKRLYSVWKSMRQRCYNPNNYKYKNYGARGISVCDEWRDYSKFEEWAFENGYNENAKYGDCTIDRINVNGNYEPTNCRFISTQDQCYNKTNLHYITYDGQTKCLSEWAKFLGIKESTLRMRLINYKWNIDKSFNTKDGRSNRKNRQDIKTSNKVILQYDINGDLLKEWSSITEASKELKINIGNISACCRQQRRSAGNFIWRFKGVI